MGPNPGLLDGGAEPSDAIDIMDRMVAIGDIPVFDHSRRLHDVTPLSARLCS